MLPDTRAAAEQAALTKQAGWQRLRERYRQALEREERRIGRALLNGEPVDQRDIDRRRGFWAGVQAVLDTPEQAEQQLDRWLRAQGGDRT